MDYSSTEKNKNGNTITNGKEVQQPYDVQTGSQYNNDEDLEHLATANSSTSHEHAHHAPPASAAVATDHQASNTERIILKRTLEQQRGEYDAKVRDYKALRNDYSSLKEACASERKEMKLRSEKEEALLTEANRHMSTLNTDIRYLKRKVDDHNIYNQRKWAKVARQKSDNSLKQDHHELEEAHMTKNAALTAKYDLYKSKNDQDLKDANDKNTALSLETELSKDSLVKSNEEVAALIHKTTSLQRQNEDLQAVVAGHSSSNERKQLRILEKAKTIEKLEDELDNEKMRYTKEKKKSKIREENLEEQLLTLISSEEGSNQI
mmetsp:Transcript_18620/g.27586  ORF Transcript_18620/g.27586 Transcript_18620/m.27586 type:complete len:321 (+) Transcript_18620:299-1261(+)